MKSKWQFFNLFSVLALVALVFLPLQNRNLLGQQWRGIYHRIGGSMFPSPVTEANSPLVQLYYLKNNPPTKISGELDEDEATELMQNIVNRHPNDAAALAYYLRSERKFSRRLNEKGPLSSGNPEWSVRVDEYNDTLAPTEVHPTIHPNFGKIRHNGPFETKESYEDTLALIRRGQKLEPQNTYFDWILIFLLLHGDREMQAIEVLEKAWQKTDFNDHTNDEFMAIAKYRGQLGLETEIKYMNFSATQLSHLSWIRAVQRYLAQHTMALRMYKRESEALDWGRKCMSFSRPLRLKGGPLINSSVGSYVEREFLLQTHLPLPPIPIKRNGEKPIPASQLTAHPYSLSHLARQLRQPKVVAELEKEWDVLQNWKVKGSSELEGIVSPNIFVPLGVLQRFTRYCVMALTLSSLLWVSIGLIQRLKLIRHLDEKPNTSIFFIGGGIGTLLLVAGNVGFEWFKISSEPMAFCGFGHYPSEILFPSVINFAGFGDHGNWRFTIGAMPLLLIWLALFTSGAMRWKIGPRPAKSNLSYDDLAGHHIHYLLPIYFFDQVITFIKTTFFFMLRCVVPIGILFGLFAALALIPIDLRDDSGNQRRVLTFFSTYGVLFGVLVLAPASLILLQAFVQRSAPRESFQNLSAFLCRAQALLAGLLVMAMLILAILLPVQASYTKKFNEQFAIIERRQTIQTLQARGLLPRG
jgi:hypothetical protein